MRDFPFITGYYYHIYNRGVEKRDIFTNHWDYMRFLETLNFYRKKPLSTKLSDFRRGVVKFKKVKNQIEIIRIFCYCFMPNHFHLLIQQLKEGGISDFLRKISNSYTRYFNTKYDRIGSLFQGTFKSKFIESDEYLLQLSKYIHKNPFPLVKWKDKNYPYSSYKYYLSGDNHPFCDTEFISSYFSKNNPNLDYKSFVEESELEDSSLYGLFIDNED